LSIADLQEGEKGIVLDVSNDGIPLKLIEMGCLPGIEVQLIQRAPFKDPLCININGSVLAIRENFARLIEIERL
jgi:ferrous iron transport protein A